jgi:hypothetical protein
MTTIFKRFIKLQLKLEDLISQSFLSTEMKIEYKTLLQKRYLLFTD